MTIFEQCITDFAVSLVIQVKVVDSQHHLPQKRNLPSSFWHNRIVQKTRN